jgi:hypothetical protein
MSYNTIYSCANDSSFQGRLTSAVAQEGAFDPGQVMFQLRWVVSTAADIEAAYASALAADNPNPGGDESVITDGMILSAVQANWDEAWESPPATPPLNGVG